MLGNTRGAPGDGAPSTCGHTDSARLHTLSPPMAQRDPRHRLLGGQGSMATSPPTLLPLAGWWGARTPGRWLGTRT